MKTKSQSTMTSEKPAEPASEFDRFRDFVKQVVSVPKEEIDKRQAKYDKKKAAKKKSRASV